MRRYLVVALALGLVLAMVVSLTGCGGDESKAKEYVQKGDQIIDGIESETEELAGQLETIFTELASGEVSSSATVDKMVSDLEGASENALKEAQKAKAEFEKVADLDGVEKYQEYAKLRIDVIDGVTELIEETVKYLEGLGKVLAAAEAGQAVDIAQVEKDATAFFTKMMSIQEKTTEQGDEADELKSELNL